MIWKQKSCMYTIIWKNFIPQKNYVAGSTNSAAFSAGNWILLCAKHRNALYVVLIVFILVGYIMQSGGFNANAFGPYAGF